MGNLIKKTDGATTTTYVQDLNGGLPVVLIKADGTNTCKYTYGQDRLKMTKNSTDYYFYYDGLGSTRTITNTSGVVKARYVYDVYGKKLASECNEDAALTNQPFLFTGELYDEDTELIYLRARWYDPTTGRFLTRDTHWGSPNDPQSFHLYNYCYNNPISYVDPSGNDVGNGNLGIRTQITVAQMDLMTSTEVVQMQNLVRWLTPTTSDLMGGYSVWSGATGLGPYLGNPIIGGQLARLIAGGMAALMIGSCIIGGPSSWKNPTPDSGEPEEPKESWTYIRILFGWWDPNPETLGDPEKPKTWISPYDAVEPHLIKSIDDIAYLMGKIRQDEYEKLKESGGQKYKKATLIVGDTSYLTGPIVPAITEEMRNLSPNPDLFLGTGETPGGIPEFEVPNQPVPRDAWITLISDP